MPSWSCPVVEDRDERATTDSSISPGGGLPAWLVRAENLGTSNDGLNTGVGDVDLSKHVTGGDGTEKLALPRRFHAGRDDGWCLRLPWAACKRSACGVASWEKG